MGQGQLSSPVVAIYKAIGMADVDAQLYLEFMGGYLEALKLPLHDRKKAAAAVVAKLENTSKIHVLLHAIMTALSRCLEIDLRCIAGLRAARAGVAIERYRLAKGRLPGELSELVPIYLESIPIDPFDGRELRYEVFEKGFVVYSIGEDGSDDGGREKPEKKRDGGKPYDVTFIIER